MDGTPMNEEVFSVGVPCPDYPTPCRHTYPHVKIYFNPFAFSVEQNNEFLAKGYEVMPIRVPS